MTAKVKPDLWQQLLHYRPTPVIFILGGNDITFTSNPMDIYSCTQDRIHNVLEILARAFAFGILPRARFRDPRYDITEFDRQCRHRSEQGVFCPIKAH